MKTAQELVDEFFDTIRRDYTSDVLREIDSLLEVRFEERHNREIADLEGEIVRLEELLEDNDIEH